jgi:hypothetical protein
VVCRAFLRPSGIGRRHDGGENTENDEELAHLLLLSPVARFSGIRQLSLSLYIIAQLIKKYKY